MCSIFTKYIVKIETVLYNVTKSVDETPTISRKNEV